ncbi:MAG: murein L,D-transpeptidase, partial [Pseudolabrys sp.]
MKSARFDRLLASTALVLVLALSSQVGAAQQTENPTTASVPVPDTTLPAPLTAKDIEAPAKQVAPGPTKEEPKQNATTAPAEPTKAATNAAPADAVGEKLRELITGRQFDRLVSRKSDRAGIEAYYSSHNYAPIWISNNAGNDRAKAAIAYLGLADAVGLDPNDYPTPDFKSATTADALAEAELKLTASALTFARHAQIGRIHFTRVSADIQYDLAAPEPADVLAKLGDSSDPGKVLDAYNPPQAEFKALRAKLADLRKGPAPAETKTAQKPELPRVHVPDGKILRPGMKDPRVTAVRKRLDIAGDKENQLYDDAV